MAFDFKQTNPDHLGFQFLENLSTAYWYSQVLFTGLELSLFKLLEQGVVSVKALAREANCHGPELLRLLRAMEGIGLVTCQKENWYNTQAASLFLVPGKKDYMGDFFLYRKYMRPQWETLTQKVCPKQEMPVAALSYEERNRRYLSSTDTLVRQKAREIVQLLPGQIKGPILDIGGGAGSLIRALQTIIPGACATLFDIPEVIEAAHTLYPDKKDWEKITPVSGDFRTHEFEDKFSLICMSNFLHTYGPEEAKQLLLKACTQLSPNGILILHDYFPDRKGRVPEKGVLYDLAMMLNTFNGVCHDSATITQWLEEAQITTIGITDLNTDSTVILATKQKEKSAIKPGNHPVAPAGGT